MVFIAHTNGGNEAPLTAKNVDAAEMDFVRTCGLTPQRAAALRTEVDRNKVVSVETSIDDAVKAKFRYAGPGGCGRDWKFLLQSMTIRGRKVSPLPTAKDHWVAGGSCTTKESHPPRSVPGRPLGFT